MDIVQPNTPFTVFPFFFSLPIRGLEKLHRTLSSIINQGFACSVAVAVIVVVTCSLSLPGPHILRHIFLLGLMIHGAMTVCGGNYWLDMLFSSLPRTNLIKRPKIPGNFSLSLQSDAIQNTFPPQKKNKTKNPKQKRCTLTFYSDFPPLRKNTSDCWFALCSNPQAENKVGQTDTPLVSHTSKIVTSITLFFSPFNFCLLLLEDFLALMHRLSLRLCCLRAANLTSGGPDSSGFHLFYCW